MKKHTLETTKTGRYYTLGTLSDSTKEIVFVFHGYGELAKEFIQNFETIKSEQRFIIALEALNKFYFRGFSGKIGASWMTREDRENEITDYLKFCDNLYSQYSNQISPITKITLFGFSQGGATASRWFVNSVLPNSRLVLWGSSIPPDIDYNTLREKLFSKVTIVIGDQDEFISEDSIKDEVERLHKMNIDFELKKYPGNHKIQPGLFKKLNLFY